MIFFPARLSPRYMASYGWLLFSFWVWMSFEHISLAETNTTQKLKIVSQAKGIRNVYLQTTNGWKNLTHFKNPHHIYDYAASPDGKWAYVFHMDFSPVKISVYDTIERKLKYRFEPGAWGTFSWSPSNRIIMEMRAGTGGYFPSVYALDGTVIYDTWGNSNIREAAIATVSPSKEHILYIPEHSHLPNKIEIIRVTDGAIWYYGKEKLAAADFTWTASDKIKINRLTATPEVTRPLEIDVSAYTKSHPPDRRFILTN